MECFEKLINFENLYNSYKASLKGKGQKGGAIRFNIMALEAIYIIKRSLIEHTYTIAPYQTFTITEPKVRIIKSGSFRDKVLQHCLCDYVLLPQMKNVFIQNNFAGQVNKGTHFGLNTLSEQFRDYYNKYGYEGYILKCDIKKFFYSINHDILKGIIRQHFSDKNIQWVCDLLIDSVEGNVGLPLGNQSAQVFALMYLNSLDHLITDDMCCKYYGRYMDDFYLISHDKDFLKDCLKRIEKHLAKLALELNNKTEIVPIKKGIRFLGFHTYITKNGNVIRKLTGDKKRQIKKRLRTYAALVKQGKMSEQNFYTRYESWKNHALNGNCFNLICGMDEFVRELMDKEKRKEKRIIVAGGRDFCEYSILASELHKYMDKRDEYSYTIVSGMAKGADRLGERFALENHLKVCRFPAQWGEYGKAAGFIRNKEMLDFISQSDCEGVLFAFWDGKSKGTKNMIDIARKNNIPVHIVSYNRDKKIF